MTNITQLHSIDDQYDDHQAAEFERQHWNAIGEIEFYVVQNNKDCFDIDILDYSGCAGGLDETLGIQYSMEEGILDVDIKSLKEGVTYTLHAVEVTWYRGDGWETDDDQEYEYAFMSAKSTIYSRMEQKIINWWNFINYKSKGLLRFLKS